MTTPLDVGAYVLARLGRMDTFKLQKLVYYSQAWHVAVFDETLFPDPIQAWPDGPVAPTLFAKHAGRAKVDRISGGDPRALAHRQALVVDLVCHHYGHLSGDELSALTHSEAPWLDARLGLEPQQWSKRVIKPTAMAKYYRPRKLDGRTVRNLASSGLWPSAAVDDRDFARDLKEIRESFKDGGLDEPYGDLYSAQFVVSSESPTTPRVRGASRPIRRAR